MKLDFLVKSQFFYLDYNVCAQSYTWQYSMRNECAYLITWASIVNCLLIKQMAKMCFFIFDVCVILITKGTWLNSRWGPRGKRLLRILH